MLNFKSFRSASNVLADIEFMHMIRKGQFAIDGAAAISFAVQHEGGICSARKNPSRAKQSDRTKPPLKKWDVNVSYGTSPNEKPASSLGETRVFLLL